MSRASRSRSTTADPARSSTRANRPLTPAPPRTPVATPSSPESAVPDGIDFHARAVKTFGAGAALVPMTVLGLASLLVLWGSQSSVRGIAGFVLAVMSCPTLAFFGFPMASGSTRWLATILTSAALWAGLGILAARRSTSRAIAGWPEWRREWLRLAVGVWIGAFVGFVIAAILLVVSS